MMRFAYADPPYPGCANLYPEKREVDHEQMIRHLCEEFPDGWALSTHSNALASLLPMCPGDVRVGAWVKPWAVWRLGGGASVPYTWEPVLWRSARGRDAIRTKRYGIVARDWIAVSPLMKQRVIGEKPRQFAWWVFALLGAGEPGDEMVDLFPGSGAIGEAWDIWMASRTTSENYHLWDGEG